VQNNTQRRKGTIERTTDDRKGQKLWATNNTGEKENQKLAMHERGCEKKPESALTGQSGKKKLLSFQPNKAPVSGRKRGGELASNSALNWG